MYAATQKNCFVKIFQNSEESTHSGVMFTFKLQAKSIIFIADNKQPASCVYKEALEISTKGLK